MKVKTSVTLSTELLKEISRATDTTNRSAFIEEASWDYIRRIRRRDKDTRDLDIINKHSDLLNQEAADTLDFQVDE